MSDFRGILDGILTRREPGKRKIKPNVHAIEDMLDEVGLGGGPDTSGAAAAAASAAMDDDDDSEEDVDWGAQHKSLVDKATAKGDDSEPASSSSSSDDDDDSDDDSSESGSDDGEDEDKVEAAHTDRTGGTVASAAASDVVLLEAGKSLGTPLCWVCVSNASNIEEDELVQCNGCGLRVHIGCYGNLVEPGSQAGSVSDDDEEAWVCEACCAGVETPVCALCPNDGGAFKQCDMDETWVHAICSLYVQGVYWGTPETMRPVVLSKIPVSAWGARKCDLCTDPENATTGVLVRCDAGMCRTWMHATCAQRHGLLQEASAADDVADPYFASCKVHCERLSTKSAKRRWTTLSRQQRAATGAAPGRAAVMADNEVAAAVIAEYGRERQRWLRENGATVAASRRFLTDVRKSVAEREERKLTADRGPMKPELTIAFVQRYNALDAEETKLETAVKGSRAEQTILTGTARTLRNDLEHLEATRKAADAHRTALVSVVHLFRRRMASVGCDLNQPHHWLLRRRSSSSSQARGCNASASTDISPSRILSAPNIFEAPRCWKCDSKDKPFLMVECDTCHRNIHTTCHDPPLKKVPKKHRFKLWQCADCDSDDETDDDSESGAAAVDVDAPRPVRSRRGLPPSRYTLDDDDLTKALSASKRIESSGNSNGSGKRRRRIGEADVGMRRAKAPTGPSAGVLVDATTVRRRAEPQEPIDLDTKCGVVRQDTSDNRLCRRSLACKLHRLADRQAVTGRSRDFEDLLIDHLLVIGKMGDPKMSTAEIRARADASGRSAPLTPVKRRSSKAVPVSLAPPSQPP